MHKKLAPLAVVAAVVGSLAIASPAHAAEPSVVINEVQSNSAVDAPDFVELYNAGSTAVDVSGWIVRDDDDAHAAVIDPGTVLAPGAFLVIETEAAGGFGLGKADEARLFTADGTTLVDEYAWTEHAFSEGRIPDGTGAFVDTEPTPGEPNIIRDAAPGYDADSAIAINEVMSDDPHDGEDWVELTNTGDAPVDVSGWILRDDDDMSALPIAAGTMIAPGDFLVIETNVTDAGFGLGKADKIRLYLPDGLGLVDEYAWTEHAFTEGRIPDGTGVFVDTEPTPGAPNVARAVASPVVINEVESNGDPRGDWVELANTDLTHTADVSGWTLIDGDPAHDPIVLPAGTTIESGGYLGIVTDEAFGLGGTDSVTLRDADDNVIATLSWEGHSPTTIGRCPDMTGPFTDTAEGTFELPNACDGGDTEPVEAEPWPFGDEVQEAVAPGTWGEDMSGLDIASDGTVYAVNNDNAEIFRLSGGPGTYTIAESWVPHYPDGTGTPDAEGITVAGDGAIFLSTERDNRFKSVSRPSVLRVELGTAGASTTTHEWNLTEVTGPLGANAGIEAIEWISDADATRLGLRGVDGAYDPAAFGDHFGGVFVVAVEQTGDLHVLVLEADGGITLLQTVGSTAAVPVVMGLDWHAGGNELWALCDEACENRHALFTVADGVLTWQADHHAPASMNTSFTNEGLAIARCAADSSVSAVLWISDTAHDGVSLRVALGAECETPGEPGDGDAGDTGDPEPVDDEVLDGADDGGVTVDGRAERGATVTVTVPGHGGETVNLWLHSDPVLLGTPLLTAAGTAQVTIPQNAPLGAHRLVVQAPDGTLIGWAPLQIVPAATAAGTLPVTGDEVSPWLAVSALAMVVLGGILIARRVRTR